MAEISTIARPYAQALFAAATAAGNTGAWLPALDAIAAVVQHPEVAVALGNPQLSDARRYELIAGMAGETLAGPLAELLRVMIENNRLSAVPELAAQFHVLKNAADGVADCVIESAFPMNDGEVTSLVKALSSKFPLQLKPVVRLNPALIGGVRVTVGDRVLDSSVRARLDAMQARLTA